MLSKAWICVWMCISRETSLPGRIYYLIGTEGPNLARRRAFETVLIKHRWTEEELSEEREAHGSCRWERVVRPSTRSLSLSHSPSLPPFLPFSSGLRRSLLELERRVRSSLSSSSRRAFLQPLTASPWIWELKELLGLSLRSPCFSPAHTGRPEKVSRLCVFYFSRR